MTCISIWTTAFISICIYLVINLSALFCFWSLLDLILSLMLILSTIAPLILLYLNVLVLSFNLDAIISVPWLFQPSLIWVFKWLNWDTQVSPTKLGYSNKEKKPSAPSVDTLMFSLNARNFDLLRTASLTKSEVGCKRYFKPKSRSYD